MRRDLLRGGALVPLTALFKEYGADPTKGRSIRGPSPPWRRSSWSACGASIAVVKAAMVYYRRH
jgi:hypothetical protein